MIKIGGKIISPFLNKFSSLKRSVSTVISQNIRISVENQNLTDYEHIKTDLKMGFKYHKDFINESQEKRIMDIIEKDLASKTYIRDHFDNVIFEFKEMERPKWPVDVMAIFAKMKREIFENNETIIPAAHVIDISPNGYVKPHIDNYKYCGSTICGLTLLSSVVLQLIPQGTQNVQINILLERHSLYAMTNKIRTSYTHEILRKEDSVFGDERINRERFVSVILRSKPE